MRTGRAGFCTGCSGEWGQSGIGELQPIPAYKASFALDVTMPDGRKRVTFATTPKMWTYLMLQTVAGAIECRGC
jgi:hypothetical protein